jgi:hypothetical protein
VASSNTNFFHASPLLIEMPTNWFCYFKEKLFQQKKNLIKNLTDLIIKQMLMAK